MGVELPDEVYPIGIEPDEIALQAAGPLPLNWQRGSKAELENVKNIFPLSGWIIRRRRAARRFLAYEALLENYPQHRGKIRYTQIAPQITRRKYEISGYSPPAGTEARPD